MSETALARPVLAKYCTGMGVDLGFGGDPIVPTAITFDMESPYTNVGGSGQILKGDVRNLSMFCDNSLDFIFQSHLLEDFTWEELPSIVYGIRRILKPGGLFVNCMPVEQVYKKHCEATGQPHNQAHQNHDFSLETFKVRVLDLTGPWDLVYECSLIDTYSFHIVVRKPL
jgi:predicted SAM-dependent methyltransferase